jgi:soluble lytic murein transglycosylase-like protein
MSTFPARFRRRSDRRSPQRSPRPALRLAARVTAATAAGAVAVTLAPAAPASADDQPLPSGRRMVTHTVQPGDTATGLAVRYHAWTAELISHNHLDDSAGLVVGQRIEVPVVRAAARRDRADRPARPQQSAERRAPRRTPDRTRRPAPAPTSADPSRATVRRVVERTARAQGVDPNLAAAVSWQEAGWQMHHVSSANAIGAMQVLPGTGSWMSIYAGRDLRLRDTEDNVLAGVLLLKVLRDHTGNRRDKIGAYYQGLGAVREHGLYGETRAYVDNVVAIKRRLDRGLPPA